MQFCLVTDFLAWTCYGSLWLTDLLAGDNEVLIFGLPTFKLVVDPPALQIHIALIIIFQLVVIAIPEILGIFDKPANLSVADHPLLHPICELLHHRPVQFDNRHYLLVELNAFVVFSVEPLLTTFPLQLIQQCLHTLILSLLYRSDLQLVLNIFEDFILKGQQFNQFRCHV